MSRAKSVLRKDPNAMSDQVVSTSKTEFPPRLPNVRSGVSPASQLRPTSPATQNNQSFQARVPVVVGEASFRGSLPIDGLISGQLSPNGGNLSVSQKRRGANVDSVPELSGEIRFRDMLRVNGHVAGKIMSEKGTLIIDAAARVDADIDVGIAIISGTVIGQVTASERVELNSEAIINGNISTRALSIKPGAIFHGDCCMLKKASDREL
jgi:cytoskeletal protein CcmA (bactofilin family)